MNTRHNTSSSDLAFTNDPDAIIRATNALRREAQATVACAQAIAIARILAQRLPTLPVSPPPADLPASAPPSTSQPLHPCFLGLPHWLAHPRHCLCLPPAQLGRHTLHPPPPDPTGHPLVNPDAHVPDPSPPPDPTNHPHFDFMRMILEAQHASIRQAQVDRDAQEAKQVSNADRIAHLEDAILLLLVKHKPPPAADKSASNRPSGRVDLQRFRTADAPVYSGPYHVVEPFLKWINAVQIFFSLTGVTHDMDKIILIGCLICETNTLSFYSRSLDSFLSLSWSDFKLRLFSFALPPLWRLKLCKQSQQLWMGESETFTAYSTRARTLQSLLNFDAPSLSDLDLAKIVISGLTPELKPWTANFELLEASPFDYNNFKKRVLRLLESVNAQRSTGCMRQNAPASTSTSTPSPSDRPGRKDTIWRIHSYLDSQGRCHHCKKNCGSAPGSCTNPINHGFVEIPASFVTPSKPPNYKPPKASSPAVSTMGRPTQPPAG
ncbi:hypothetical protein PCASD_18197 [Puccinia coronata f. sp. avenae]|uniref:Retrotransposon gag domain-containing protein n=1 Tax=Puccinia coronata f. sp. avenae TaxID=200324 RepID=A0A2N5T2D6_9BASI|nr:hypothetical protein PCASD_18197 [Puccinia coronata f. sp. avenae]